MSEQEPKPIEEHAVPEATEPGRRWGRLITDTAHLSIATVFSFFISIATSILIPKLLAPTLFGVWRTFQTVMQYTVHSHVGLLNAFVKEGPRHYANDPEGRYQRISGIVLAAMLFAGAVEIIATVAVAFFVDETLIKAAVVLLAVLLFVQQIYTWSDFCLLVTKQFGLKSKALAAFSVLRTALMLSLLWAFGLLGMLAGLAAAQLIIFVWVIRSGNLRLRPQWDRAEARRLFIIGAPMISIVLVETLIQTTDRIIVVTFLGMTAMGLYGIAAIVTPLILMLPQSLRQVVGVEVFHLAAETGDPRPIAGLFHRSVEALSLTAPILCAGAYLGSDWGVVYVLPEYLPGLWPLKILCLGLFPLALSQVCFDVLIVARCEYFTIITGLLVAAANVVASMAYIGYFDGWLGGIAVIHSAGFSVLALILMSRALWLVGKRDRSPMHIGGLASFWLRNLWPAAWLFIAAAIIERIGPQLNSAISFWEGTGWTTLRVIVLMIAAIPLLLRLWKLGGLKALKGRK